MGFLSKEINPINSAKILQLQKKIVLTISNHRATIWTNLLKKYMNSGHLS